MKPKSFAEIQKRHDKLAVELAVLSQKIDAWTATLQKQKPKRAKK